MGSRGSKGAGAPAPDGGDAGPAGGLGGVAGQRSRRWLPRPTRLPSACFCLPSPAAFHDQQHEEGGERLNRKACVAESATKSASGTVGSCWKFEVPQPSQATCSSSSCSGLDERCQDQESASHTDPGDGSSSSSSSQAAATNWTSNSLSRSRSHFGSVPDVIASRFGRAGSLGSSGARSIFPASYSVHNAGDNHVRKESSGSSDLRNGMQEGGLSVDNASSQDIIGSNTDSGAVVSGHSHRNLVCTGNYGGHPSRRHRPQEPLEGGIRFSRTLSVGRLRDRVLHRPQFSDGFSGPASLEGGPIECHDNGIGRRTMHHSMRDRLLSDGHSNMFSGSSSRHPTSLFSSMESSSLDYVSETPQSREVGSQDILENRSAFVERRWRIRSQVRALQQLGNRVENFSRHDRSCISSGQHRTGHCTCRRNIGSGSDDSRSARSSISRIVMLAEALFEVLEEIHQQAVVLASRPSESSIGSVPAPKEVVEHMPLRIYKKPQKHHSDEAAQCYICLVEYEEGDSMRILPCYHEFHQTCVDKWLKEIHRVCPLCRGDVCISDLPSTEKFS